MKLHLLVEHATYGNPPVTFWRPVTEKTRWSRRGDWHHSTRTGSRLFGATALKAAAPRGGFMVNEIPYSKIDPRELKDLEAEFGRTLTPELAQCLIRYRINRDAIELMLRNGAGAGPLSAAGFSEISEIHVEVALASQAAPQTEDAGSKEEGEEEMRPGRQPARGTGRTGSSAARKAVA